MGPTYCSYVLSWFETPPIVQRGCADLHETPDMPEPQLGGAVCVDHDIDGKKVSNEQFLSLFIFIFI